MNILYLYRNIRKATRYTQCDRKTQHDSSVIHVSTKNHDENTCKNWSWKWNEHTNTHTYHHTILVSEFNRRHGILVHFIYSLLFCVRVCVSVELIWLFPFSIHSSTIIRWFAHLFPSISFPNHVRLAGWLCAVSRIRIWCNEMILMCRLVFWVCGLMNLH